MQRFYLPSLDVNEGIVEIHDARVVFQATKVLRLKTGSRFSIFDQNNGFLIKI